MPERDWKPDLYVVARILEALWRHEGPIAKTRLQVASNLNYDIFTRYLDWMISKGLVRAEHEPDGHERFQLTQEGQEAYRRVVQWVNDVVFGRFQER